MGHDKTSHKARRFRGAFAAAAAAASVMATGACGSSDSVETVLQSQALTEVSGPPPVDPRTALMMEGANTKILGGTGVYNSLHGNKAVANKEGGTTRGIFGGYREMDLRGLTTSELLELEDSINGWGAGAIPGLNLPGPLERTCLLRSDFSEDRQHCSFVVKHPYQGLSIQAVAVTFTLPTGAGMFAIAELSNALLSASQQLGDSSAANGVAEATATAYMAAAGRVANLRTEGLANGLLRAVAANGSGLPGSPIGVAVSVVIPTTGAKNVWVSVAPVASIGAELGIGVSASLVALDNTLSKKAVADFLTGNGWSGCVAAGVFTGCALRSGADPLHGPWGFSLGITLPPTAFSASASFGYAVPVCPPATLWSADAGDCVEPPGLPAPPGAPGDTRCVSETTYRTGPSTTATCDAPHSVCNPGGLSPCACDYGAGYVYRPNSQSCQCDVNRGREQKADGSCGCAAQRPLLGRDGVCRKCAEGQRGPECAPVGGLRIKIEGVRKGGSGTRNYVSRNYYYPASNLAGYPRFEGYTRQIGCYFGNYCPGAQPPQYGRLVIPYATGDVRGQELFFDIYQDTNGIGYEKLLDFNPPEEITTFITCVAEGRRDETAAACGVDWWRDNN